MSVGKTSYQYMPLFLKILTGHALSCFLLFFIGVWKIIAAHPVLPSLMFVVSGLYFGICGVVFLTRWEYAREIYLGVFSMGAMFLLGADASLFMFLVLFTIAIPIIWYLYKNKSVSNYFHHNK